jgi:membrane-associated phospholipid phosphatase
MTIIGLDRNDIWKFDRQATHQNPDNYESSQLISDIGMNVTLFLPVLLALDDEIRQDWLDVLLIYLETQAIGANLYLWAGPVTNDRIRPFVYNSGYPWEMKVGTGAQDSFFSGHTSWTAGASFFMAKVYSDYHPELGSKKYWLFAAAAIPPAFVGFYRYQAGKHFPTDILAGFTIGAATGILVPHLHKNKKKKSYSLAPFFGGFSGVAFTMKF